MEKCGHRRCIHTFYGTNIPMAGEGGTLGVAHLCTLLAAPRKPLKKHRHGGKRPRDRPGQATKQATGRFDFITRSA